jgi:hypothetical protein
VSAVVKTLAAAYVLFLLSACGKEVGRIPFTAEATKSTALQLSAGNVAFWSDLDVEYEAGAVLAYTIALEQGGRTVATASCDPLGQMSVEIGWVHSQRGTLRSRSGNGKMTCSATLTRGGPTTVEAALAFSGRPSAFTLKRADLVIKQ